MTVFKIDGIEYNVPIIGYEIEPQILDGESTARMAAIGWDMFRDPQGTIINASIEYGIPTSKNADFVKLFNKIMSSGKTQFFNVVLNLPTGVLLTQDMYAVPDKIKMQRITKNGITYWGNWSVRFIAKRAYNV